MKIRLPRKIQHNNLQSKQKVYTMDSTTKAMLSNQDILGNSFLMDNRNRSFQLGDSSTQSIYHQNLFKVRSISNYDEQLQKDKSQNQIISMVTKHSFLPKITYNNFSHNRYGDLELRMNRKIFVQQDLITKQHPYRFAEQSRDFYISPAKENKLTQPVSMKIKTKNEKKEKPVS